MAEASLVAFGDLADRYEYMKKTKDFAQKHADTIFEFGRYPYRNEVLGRESTPEEVEYLKTADTYGQ